jgi:cytochrome c-type biogenesis protein CcmE
MQHYVSAPTSPTRRLKVGAGVAVIAATLVGLVAWAMTRPDSTSFYLTVEELKTQGPSSTEDFRVNGKVVPGSLSRNGIQTTFAISDGAGNLEIVTEQPLPDAFSSGYRSDPGSVEVVAEGRYDGGTLMADKVLAKCPSKFKAKQ